MQKQQPAKNLAQVEASEVDMDVHAAILAAVRGIRFGSVEIVIHDSKVVQIESKEKIRLAPRQENPRR